MPGHPTVTSLVRLLLVSITLVAAFTANASSQAPPAPPGSYPVGMLNLGPNNAPMASEPILIIATGQDGTVDDFNLESSPSGYVSVFIGQGNWTITADLQEPNSPGNTQSAYLSLNVDGGPQNATLNYEAVGSLKLTATDKSGNPVGGAQIAGSCINQVYSIAELDGQVYTNAAGVALLPRVPSGNCVFTVSTGALAGSKTESIAQGQFLQDTIPMSPVPQGLPWQYIAEAVVLLIAIVAAIWWWATGRRHKQPQHPSLQRPPAQPAAHRAPTHARAAQEKTQEKTPEFNAVYRTLNETEQKVVDLLAAEKKPMKQSRIFSTLLIPKTTLIRTINTLQTKGLVKTVPLGNTRMVQLENWMKPSGK